MPKRQITGNYGPHDLAMSLALPHDWEYRVAAGDVDRAEIKIELEVTSSDRGYTVKSTMLAPSLLARQMGDTEIIETSKIEMGLSRDKAIDRINRFDGMSVVRFQRQPTEEKSHDI